MWCLWLPYFLGRNRKNYSCDISLCGLHLLKVMKKVDHEFHAVNATRHSVKDAHSDILKMATYWIVILHSQLIKL